MAGQAMAKAERQNRVLYTETSQKVTPIVRGAFGTGLIGGAGIDIQAGIFAEEYLTTLRGDKMVKAFAEMLNDPAVAKELRIVSMPILTAEVRFEPPDEPNADELDAADLCNANLLRRPSGKYGTEHFITTPWRQRLYEILASLEYGASVFHRDRDYVRETDKQIFSRLRYIFPFSIKRYHVSDDDEWLGIRQEWFAAGTGRYLRHDVKPEELALYPWQIRGILFRGMPFIRPMWKPWSIKNIVEKLEVINAQRQAAPPPDYEYSKENPDDEEVEASKDMMEALRQGPTDRTYVRRPHGSKLGFVQPSAQGADTHKIIQQKTVDIARAGAGQGTELGSTSAGSRSTAEQLLAQTTMLQNAVAAWIADIESEGIAGQPGLAQELVEMNYPPGTRHPRMVFGQIDKDAALKHVPVVTKAFQDGTLTKTPKDEDHLRKITGWPALDKDEAAVVKAEQEAADERDREFRDRQLEAGVVPGDDPPSNGNGNGNRPQPKPRNRNPRPDSNADLQRDLADVGADAIRMEIDAIKDAPVGATVGVERRTRPGRRQPTGFERAVVDFGGIAADLGSVEEQYLTRMQTAVLRATNDVATRIRSGELTVDAGKNGDIPLKFKNELQQGLESVLIRAFRIGRRKAAEMIDRQGDLAGKPTAIATSVDILGKVALSNTGVERLTLQAVTDVTSIFDEMLANFMREIQDGDAQGLVPDEIADFLEANMPRAAGPSARKTAARAATTAFNEGEVDIISDQLEIVQFVLRSELRDENTCEPCDGLDGMKLEVGTKQFREFLPPAKCDGRKLCRGIIIPVRS